MVNPYNLHTLTNKTNKSSSSTTTSMNLKTMIQQHIRGAVRALSRAKTIILEVFRENHLKCIKKRPKKDKYMKSLLFDSFRLHYNWCTSKSHVMPIPSLNSSYVNYYDHQHEGQFCHNGAIYEKEEELEGQIFGYLQWLEENKDGKVVNSSNIEGNNVENEIDELADRFIASCHEKFMLEKIESYRRFHDMLVRSM